MCARVHVHVRASLHGHVYVCMCRLVLANVRALGMAPRDVILGANKKDTPAVIAFFLKQRKYPIVLRSEARTLRRIP